MSKFRQLDSKWTFSRMKGKFRDLLVLPSLLGHDFDALAQQLCKKTQLPKLHHVFCLQVLFLLECSSVAPVLPWSSTLAVDHGGRDAARAPQSGEESADCATCGATSNSRSRWRWPVAQRGGLDAAVQVPEYVAAQNTAPALAVYAVPAPVYVSNTTTPAPVAVCNTPAPAMHTTCKEYTSYYTPSSTLSSRT